ncbi:unnamed protein product, partial [Prorocentrum cordatum]
HGGAWDPSGGSLADPVAQSLYPPAKAQRHRGGGDGHPTDGQCPGSPGERASASAVPERRERRGREGEGAAGAAQAPTPQEPVALPRAADALEDLDPPTGARYTDALLAWLRDQAALPRVELAATVRAAGVLRRASALDADAEALIKERALGPLAAALAAEPAASSAAGGLAAPPPLPGGADLGPLTQDLLEALELDSGQLGERWLPAARAEVRRQGLLRRWALWDEEQGPGWIAWLGFHLSGGDGGAPWELSSEGEAFGSGEPALDDVACALLPPLARDATAGHAERLALLSLAARACERQAACRGAAQQQVEGVALLYPRLPAATAAARQFQRLFPGVRLCAAHGVGAPETLLARRGEARLAGRGALGPLRAAPAEQRPGGRVPGVGREGLPEGPARRHGLHERLPCARPRPSRCRRGRAHGRRHRRRLQRRRSGRRRPRP